MEKIPKKRGRKKKNLTKLVEQEIPNKISPIITHLPISISEQESDNDIFLKNDEKDKKIIDLENQIKLLKNKMKKKTNEQKCTVYQVNFNDNPTPKCWWCKHSFVCPKVELPTRYYNNTFYTYGIFCSYECCEAYNIDLNDECVYKRSSLLKYHYYKTYGEFKNIIKAQDWKILKEFGGNVNINDFRSSFTKNEDDYNYLKPPMISRFAQIEKINLLKNKFENDELVIKRTNPLKNNKNTLGKFIKSDNC